MRVRTLWYAPHNATFLPSVAGGAQRLGLRIRCEQPHASQVRRTDICVVWNRIARMEPTARAAALAQAPLIVMENAYLAPGTDGPWAAMALDWHNGAGRWWVGDGVARLRRLGVDPDSIPEPAAPSLQNVLICDQRGIGREPMASPLGWGHETAARIRVLGGAAILRPHPRLPRAADRATPSLQEQIARASSLVTWASSAAVPALLAGRHVAYAAPATAWATAAAPWKAGAPKGPRAGCALGPRVSWEQRVRGLAEMAWAQASAAEIASGEALARLLQVHDGNVKATGLSLGI